MLYSFLCLGVIVVFASLAGIFVNVMLYDFGIFMALLFYGLCFGTDYISTVRIKKFERYEANPIFCILSKRIGAVPSFVSIFAIGIIACAASYVILEDTVMAYMLSVCHLCIATTNYHTSKSMLQSSPQQHLEKNDP